MLTDLQQRIARAILTESPDPDLALAGGAALISLELVDRQTIDLDFFTTRPGVEELLDASVLILQRLGLGVQTQRVTPTFARLVVSDGPDTCQVDIAQDYRLMPALPGALGRTLQPEELAADKMLALFTRAEPRDYLDVYFLGRRLGKERLLELAKEKDLGFDQGVFAQMLAAIERLDRDEFETDDVTLVDIRAFFAAWRDEIST